MTIERTPVTLATGEVVDTWDPAWRAECLARHVDVLVLLRMGSLEARRDRLASLEAKRGQLYRKRVQDELAAAWAEEKRAREVAHG